MNLVTELHAIAAVLHNAGIRYAVCGGIAVTIHMMKRLAGRPQDLTDLELLEGEDG